MSKPLFQPDDAPLRQRLDLWTPGAVILALVVLAPIGSIIWIAFHPVENIWPHLLATVLPRYLATTLALMLGVAVLTAAMGTGAAWLVSQYRFPGRDWLAHALLFPLAIPACGEASSARSPCWCRRPSLLP